MAKIRQMQKLGFKADGPRHIGKRIVIGSDHRGFLLKEGLKAYLSKHYEVEDVGCFSEKRTDYTRYAAKIAKAISRDKLNTVGIGICGSGIGMSIVSNKFRGVYAARCLSKKDAELSRKHNNTNFLALPAISLKSAKRIVDAWLTTPFEKRELAYVRRFLQTLQIEGKNFK